MSHHQLICPACGGDIVIEPRQAGQEVSCPECKEATVAPTMRDIRMLPTVTVEDTSRKKKGNQWSRGRSFVFVGGILLALIAGGICGAISYRYSKIQMQAPEFYDISAVEAEYEKASLPVLMEEWEAFETHGLPPYQTPYWVLVLEAKERLKVWIWVTGIISGIGVLLVIGALVVPGKKKPKTKTRSSR